MPYAGQKEAALGQPTPDRAIMRIIPVFLAIRHQRRRHDGPQRRPQARLKRSVKGVAGGAVHMVRDGTVVVITRRGSAVGLEHENGTTR